MSYILDALRKADAERESGAVPDLLAQQYITMPADDEPGRRTGWLIALAALLGAALVGVLGWALLDRGASRDAQPIASASTAPAAAASVVLPVSPSPMPASSAVAVVTANPPTPAITPRRKPADKPAPKAGSTSESTPTPSASALPKPIPTKPAATTRASDGSAPDPSRVYQPAELPEAVRRELPAIAVNGSSYSSDPSSRLLIANGQVLHEGDKIGNGALLEKIRQRSAVLSFKGYRYEITY